MICAMDSAATPSPWPAPRPAEVRPAGLRPAEEPGRAAFEEFFARHSRELARLAYSLTGDRSDAEDITGDVLAAVWQNWERVREAEYPLAYVRRMVVNQAAQRIRRITRERRGLARLGQLTRWLDPGPDVGGMVDLRSAVLLLPPGQRACVVLRHVLDLSEDDVARTLGISTGTVKSQTAKGLARLRGTMTGPDGSAEVRHAR